ncbi:MAG: hypothetical protein HY648_12220 [Acidobacteria bacterium]|nr:hypothetical protein [Acidobacteriota bacterium]
MEEKSKLASVLVRKRFRDGSESEPVARFYTLFRARHFVLRQSAKSRESRKFQWVIRIESHE